MHALFAACTRARHLVRHAVAVLLATAALTASTTLLAAVPASAQPPTGGPVSHLVQDGQRVYSPVWDCYGHVSYGGTVIVWDKPRGGHVMDHIDVACVYGGIVRIGS